MKCLLSSVEEKIEVKEKSKEDDDFRKCYDYINLINFNKLKLVQ